MRTKALAIFIALIFFLLFVLSGCSSKEEQIESADEDTEYIESDDSEEDEEYDTESKEEFIDTGKHCEKHRYRLVPGEINYCKFSIKLEETEPDEFEVAPAETIEESHDKYGNEYGYTVTVDAYDVESYDFPVWSTTLSPDYYNPGRFFHVFGKLNVSFREDGVGFVYFEGMGLEKTGRLNEEEFYAHLEKIGEGPSFSAEINGRKYESDYEKTYTGKAPGRVLNIELSIDIQKDFNPKKNTTKVIKISGGKSVYFKISIYTDKGYLWAWGPAQSMVCYDGSE